jgi:hypothetical protein
VVRPQGYYVAILVDVGNVVNKLLWKYIQNLEIFGPRPCRNNMINIYVIGEKRGVPYLNANRYLVCLLKVLLGARNVNCYRRLNSL